MLTSILAIITGLSGPFTAITNLISNLQLAKLKATTDVEKATIDQQILEVHDKKAVIVAEAGSRIGSFLLATMTFAIALGPAVYIDKILIWDKSLGWGSTDPIDSTFQWIIMTVVGFYFVSLFRR